jgi:hypothetical protein
MKVGDVCVSPVYLLFIDFFKELEAKERLDTLALVLVPG